MTRPAKGWSGLLDGAEREALAARLVDYARQRRWFRGKSRSITGARLSDVLPLDAETVEAAANVLVVTEVRYAEGEPDLYVIPLTWAASHELPGLHAQHPHILIGAQHGLQDGMQDGMQDGLVDGLVDGLATGAAAVPLLEVARGNLTRRGHHGALVGEGSDLLGQLVPDAPALPLRVAGVEQTNSTLMFGDRVLLKVYRQPAAGPNIELEMGRFLDRACDPPCVPRVLGALTYQPDGAPSRSLGIVHQLIANRGDAWALAQRELARFFQRASDPPPPADPGGLRRGGPAWLSAVDEQAPALDARAGRFVPLAAVLGRRTGELHVALSGRPPVPDAGPDFAPEPLTADDRRTLADRTRAMLDQTLAALASSVGRGGLPAGSRALADRVLAPAGRQAVARLLAEFRDQPIDTVKIRLHGDLHLGQVLAVARAAAAADEDAAIDDFVIIDFEGEPARPLHERRAKGSPLRDVMGMVRSFDYAPEAALRQVDGGGAAGDRAGWARLWTRRVTASYLRAYLDTVAGAPFVPPDRRQLARLLTYYELEKVVYEVGYELNNRPDWLDIPLRGLLAVVGLDLDLGPGLESGT
jgi:maltose alpha-D-glucosyltransferase / alpha-amylase